MKTRTIFLAASLVASAALALPAFAQGNSGNAPGHGGGSPGQSASSPGQMKGSKDSGMEARGLRKAAEAKAARGTSRAVRTANFGTLISSIRAGKSSLEGVDDATSLNIVSADSLINGENRVALDNAIRDNQTEIDALREELSDLDLGLTEEQIDSVVATRVEPDGGLTLFTE